MSILFSSRFADYPSCSSVWQSAEYLLPLFFNLFSIHSYLMVVLLSSIFNFFKEGQFIPVHKPLKLFACCSALKGRESCRFRCSKCLDVYGRFLYTPLFIINHRILVVLFNAFSHSLTSSAFKFIPRARTVLFFTFFVYASIVNWWIDFLGHLQL